MNDWEDQTGLDDKKQTYHLIAFLEVLYSSLRWSSSHLRLGLGGNRSFFGGFGVCFRASRFLSRAFFSLSC